MDTCMEIDDSNLINTKSVFDGTFLYFISII